MKVEEKLKEKLQSQKEAEMPEPQKSYSLLKNENFNLKHKVRDLELENNVLKMKLSKISNTYMSENKLKELNYIQISVKLDVS